MKRWGPKDWIIVLLIGVMVYFITALFLARALGLESGGNDLSLQFLTAILTIISMYIGSKIVNNNKDNDHGLE